MVLSDGTTSSLRELFAENNPDKKVKYDIKDYQVHIRAFSTLSW